MVLLEGEQVMGVVWCCAYDNTQQQSKKVVCPMEAMRYGMCTMFGSLLEELLKSHHDGAACIASKDISIVVHASPRFGDTNPFPIPSLDCNGSLCMKDLPAK
jgi:hypothetical protein